MNLGKKLYLTSMDSMQNKSRRMHALIAPLAMSVLLCSCSSENVAGGGPSGTEAGNAITAQILIANAPAANARVKLIEQASLDGNGYIATANEDGIVTIENVAIGNYTMEAMLNGSAIQLPVQVNDNKGMDLGVQTLEKSVYIGGSITDFITDSTDDSLNTTGYIKFRGLDHSAFVKNGKFQVFGLPAGNLNMVFIPTGIKHDTLGVSIEVAAGDSLTTLKPETDQKPQDSIPETPKNSTLLIEDFEDGDNHNLLAPDYTTGGFGGSWALSSNPNFMFFNITPELTPQTAFNPFLAVIQDDGNGGKEVHFKAGFPDTTLYKQQYLCFGMYIGNLGWSYDLSSVDSIAFDAWGMGSGEIQISDENRKVENSSSAIPVYTAGKYPIELTEEKKRYKIAFADILPNEEDRKSVSTLAIVFHADAELHFDNLEFIGKDLLNIWKTKE